MGALPGDVLPAVPSRTQGGRPRHVAPSMLALEQLPERARNNPSPTRRGPRTDARPGTRSPRRAARRRCRPARRCSSRPRGDRPTGARPGRRAHPRALHGSPPGSTCTSGRRPPTGGARRRAGHTRRGRCARHDPRPGAGRRAPHNGSPTISADSTPSSTSSRSECGRRAPEPATAW